MTPWIRCSSLHTPWDHIIKKSLPRRRRGLRKKSSQGIGGYPLNPTSISSTGMLRTISTTTSTLFFCPGFDYVSCKPLRTPFLSTLAYSGCKSCKPWYRIWLNSLQWKGILQGAYSNNLFLKYKRISFLLVLSHIAANTSLGYTGSKLRRNIHARDNRV